MEIPYEKTMVEIFRWRVDRSGNDIAHKFEEKETTFKELDSFSNIFRLGKSLFIVSWATEICMAVGNTSLVD